MPPGWPLARSQSLERVGLVLLPGCPPMSLSCIAIGLSVSSRSLYRPLGLVARLPHGVLRMIGHEPPSARIGWSGRVVYVIYGRTLRPANSQASRGVVRYQNYLRRAVCRAERGADGAPTPPAARR